MPIGSYILNVLYNSKCLDLPEPVEDSPQNEHQQLQQQPQQNGTETHKTNQIKCLTPIFRPEFLFLTKEIRRSNVWF